MSSLRSEPTVVDLPGDLTIRSITEIHDLVDEALRNSESVTARVADDAAVDLTFVQLIESARRTACDDGKTFAMAGPPAGTLLEVLQRGGFLAEAHSERREFWFAGSEDH